MVHSGFASVVVVVVVVAAGFALGRQQHPSVQINAMTNISGRSFMYCYSECLFKSILFPAPYANVQVKVVYDADDQFQLLEVGFHLLELYYAVEKLRLEDVFF
jgi:hypothetical protein